MVKKATTKAAKTSKSTTSQAAKSEVKTNKKPTASKAVVKAPAKTVAPSAVSAVAEPKVIHNGIGFDMLRKANLALAAVLVAEAVAVVLLGSGKSLPVTTQYLSVDSLATAANGHQVLATATRHLLDVSLPVLAAVFLGLFALRHLMAATKMRQRYESQLASGISASRWISLGVGGGVMAVAVALMSGLSQLGVLAFVFFSTVAGCVLIPVVEKLHNERTDKLPDVVCGVAVAVTLLPWLAVALSVAAAVMYGGNISTALWVVYATMALFYGLLVLQTHSRIKGYKKWVDSLYAERMYMLLTFAGVSALAWLILAAVK